MKPKYIILLIAVGLFLLFAGVICIYMARGGQFLFRNEFSASMGYMVLVGDGGDQKPPYPGMVIFDASMTQQKQFIENQDCIAALKIAKLDFFFSPTREMDAHFKGRNVLYGVTGEGKEFFVATVQLELDGKILRSFPGKNQYITIDEHEFHSLLIANLKDRLGENVTISVSPDNSQKGFWGDLFWQLKKLPKK